MSLKTNIYLCLSIVIPCLLLTSCSPYLHKLDLDSLENKSTQIHEVIKKDYPFTDHKKIDWGLFSSGISQLSNKNNIHKQDYLKMREIVYKLPDARINLVSKKDKSLQEEETGGYIGFDIANTPQGNYFISRIDSSSKAWEVGMRPGYQIIGWNQKLISDIIESFPLRWGFHPATDEIRHLLACHYLSRGKEGSSAEVFYVNSKENNKGVRLTFEREKQINYPFTIGIISHQDKKKNGFQLFSDSLAYLRIDQFTPSSLRYFNNKVLSALNEITGLIIDLRENTGGYDPIAVKIAGHFATQSRTYEEAFIKEGDDIRIINTLISQPEAPQVLTNIIILTGPLTMGVAEGFAKLLQKEDHVRLLGSWSTAGSFSLPGGQLKLGDGIRLTYPIGGSMDENHKIIIEAGERAQGIRPDIFIPLNKKMIIQMANGVDVLLAEAINHIWIN